MKTIQQSAQIPEEMDGLRLDQALAKLFPDYSRERLKDWVLSGFVLLDGKTERPKHKVAAGQNIHIDATLEETECQPQHIDLDIVFEDDDIIVINKPAGLVVHPGAGNPDSTLLNALLHHAPQLKTLPRAGIVHRLDKDTTGLLVIAKTLEAHTHLVAAMQRREIERKYHAIVFGDIIAGGTVDAQMGRHPKQRTKMAVVRNGKPAITHYRVLEKFDGLTYLEVKLETGRTHQIRVHMAHIHHPILGDPSYGGRGRVPKNLTDEARERIKSFPRQALHAKQLSFIHPRTGDPMHFEAPIADDIREILDIIRR